jgi:tRNA pseudouridine38-40 synthase
VSAAPDSAAPLVRWRLDLGYDGARFAGWARQRTGRTVQGELETVLATLCRLATPPPVTAAGRTDAGVHARGQVAHVDLPAGSTRTAGGDLVRRLAGLLPADLRVFRAAPAPPGFDARFSALSRRYAYRVSDAPGGPDPLRRGEVLPVRGPLDLPAMNAAAALLLGSHDFAAYCRRREGGTTVRTLIELCWDRAEGGLAVATVEADAFCHSMVRALVGALLAVGGGRRAPDWPREVLESRVRSPAVQVAPPHGLTLEGVRYPPDGQLLARAAETRRRRGPSADATGASGPPAP